MNCQSHKECLLNYKIVKFNINNETHNNIGILRIVKITKNFTKRTKLKIKISEEEKVVRIYDFT